MKLRSLAPSDFLAVRDLLTSQRSFFGLPVEQLPGLTSPSTLQRLFIKYFAMPEDTMIFGCFDDDKLLGFASSDLLPKHKLWIAKLIVIQERLKNTSHDAASALLTHITEAAEGLGYKQHLSMVPSKFYKDQPYKWRHVNARQRYTVTILEEVLAGQRSQVPLHWSKLYGEQIFPVDTMVRLSKLT